MESGKIQNRRFISDLRQSFFFSAFFFLFSFSFLSSSAQYSFSRWDSINARNSDTTLINPWAGGLNFPQFSSIDLDGNGIKDLFVFDRTGNKTLTFINQNIPDSASYIHKPQFQKNFPPMQGWSLLADYNNDGKEDIFTANPVGGVSVYKNEYTVTEGLKFTLTDSLLMTDFGANEIEIYVSPWDIPAINDIDNDGDLDILSFGVGGFFVIFFKNVSMENFGIPDSMVFEVADACWGKFMEAFENCNDSLNVTCKGISVLPPDSISGGKHAGSTLLALDLDGDSDKELVVGDLVCNYLTMLTNGGDLNSAYMVDINTEYPPDFPVKLPIFPAAFFLDLDNDGLKDLIVAPSTINISENFKGIWFYKNTGTNSIPQFEFQTNSFLQNSMIDLGEGCNPSFLDVDGDSLQDLILGNYGYYKTGGNFLSELAYYRNTGTKTNPSFELVTRDFNQISSTGLTAIHPCFGDIDGDNDQDMLIGEEWGELFLFTNSAGPGQPVNFSSISPGYKGIDVGQYCAPKLVDVNRDGKPDLLIGERNGNLNYYENTGTRTDAEFTLVTDSFGKINILEPLAVTGYSVPRLVELDTISEYSLLVGSESGKIFLYQDIDKNLTGTFSLADTMFLDIWEGLRSTVDAADINNDGNPDLVFGNYCGGAAIYRNNAPPREKKEIPDTFSLKIFPNPASDNFYVFIPDVQTAAEILLFNILGEKVLEFRVPSAGRYYINIKDLSTGIYFCKLIIDGEIRFREKVFFVK